jgi:hypothetical protein
METIYKTIWKQAKPYYQKGRPMDIAHIEWMMEVANTIADKERLDKTLLLPLVILHDVGYSDLQDPANANYYDKDIRKAHMEAGAHIAEKILTSIPYPQDKKEIIVHYVGIHDMWAYGEVDVYVNDPVLGTFKDLDYLWIYHSVGCAAIQKVLKKTNKEMLEHLKNETSPIGGKKPFSNDSTKKLREAYLYERERALSS